MAKRVLIAEDDPSIVASLEFLMRQGGFDTRSAVDGEEALSLLATYRPHLVLLDIMLPRRSGLELCRLIRGDAALAGTRVLMLTAKGGARDIGRGLEAGADDYVTKPFSTQELVARAQALLADPVLRIAPGAAPREAP
jgi:DNA-binding response OmpR family regulator